MSTRSTISFMYSSGTIYSSYCHHDGYPEHNGNILHNCINNPTDAQIIAMRGEMSSISKVKGNKIGIAMLMSNEYGIFHSLEELSKSFEEYNYIYIEEQNKWFLIEPDFTLKPLDEMEEVKGKVYAYSIPDFVNNHLNRPIVIMNMANKDY